MHISYRRVSTDEQEKSGLGLQAQYNQIVSIFGKPFMDFTEAESGANDDRPQLLKAIAACKEHGCFLSIARQDRLGRDTHFIAGLMKDGSFEFKSADNPQATRFIKHLYAALGEDERRIISHRTKAALEVKKKQLELEGKRLGCPDITKDGRTVQQVIACNRAKRVYAKPDPKKVETLKFLRSAGKDISSIQEVATQLFGRQLSKVTIYKYLNQ